MVTKSAGSRFRKSEYPDFLRGVWTRDLLRAKQTAEEVAHAHHESGLLFAFDLGRLVLHDAYGRHRIPAFCRNSIGLGRRLAALVYEDVGRFSWCGGRHTRRTRRRKRREARALRLRKLIGVRMQR